ncbi:hypothetical protein [Ferrimicrobium sp.]|uniref:hypothetical protein n=1 Tax=Ferrimicrobium sp. TaxID=2926050 RepID=UPI00262135A4|nr:hypothetical protein [Ferrimicrobium sp.]
MGEGTSSAWVRGALGVRVVGKSDKDQAKGLLLFPEIACRAIWRAARERDSEGLLLLLTKYYLTPKQICTLQVEAGQRQVALGGELMNLASDDLTAIVGWLLKPRRPSTPKAIRDYLSRSIQPLAREFIKEDAGDLHDCDVKQWHKYLVVGVRDLRRWSREELARASRFNEGVYREVLHDENADVDDSLRILTVRARSILHRASCLEAELIREMCRSWGLGSSVDRISEHREYRDGIE